MEQEDADSFVSSTTSSKCSGEPVIPFDLQTHRKTTFTIGVLAVRGQAEAFAQYNATWNTYLTATAGRRFDPPVSFEMKPLNFNSFFTASESATVDFIYVNPTAYSCIESEYTTHSLASQISRAVIGDTVYDLNMFGGLIITRRDNDQVQTIHDLRDKIVAAASISSLGSGQMQFLEMQKAGMSYINDPGQLVFTNNQRKVVEGVLNQQFDVGFVPTGQLELFFQYSNSTAINPNNNLFKIIDPKPVFIDGKPFPFESSTSLVPEWNIAALSHVHADIQQAVQGAILALSDHADVALLLDECLQNHNNDTLDRCEFDTIPRRRCDTTLEIAQIAQQARIDGKFQAWTPTLSYMQLRSMQERLGFIELDESDNVFKCTRSTNLYDSIVCPVGHYKATEQQIDRSCENAGLPCPDEYQCLCSPCIQIIECSNGVTIHNSNTCVPYSTLLPAILVPLFVIFAVMVHLYVNFRRKQADAVWSVDPKELQFLEPCQVVGRGTFGYVVLAEYRGTKVAVKKVLPPKKWSDNKKTKRKRRSTYQSDDAAIRCDTVVVAANNLELPVDTEDPPSTPERPNPCLQTLRPNIPGFPSLEGTFAKSGENDTFTNYGLKSLASRLNSWSNSTSAFKTTHEQLKRDFVREMRHLSKLRHPCITTVMGAVVSSKAEPMLVMEYMSLGSLYDVLRNESIELDIDENTLPILQDIAQGVRFLHAASPQVIHGDLKSKNVLIDGNFRAKVTDFGWCAKCRHRATGTPFWMSPELLKGESYNNAKSDIYAFGILLWEVYSRDNPFSGENHSDVLKQVCDPVIQKRPVISRNCSYKMRELYMNCVAHDPKKRPTAEHIDLLLRVEGSVKERTNRLEQLNRELEEANQKIAESQRMQLEHFACMSHEIRTPLNCVVGIASLLDGSKLDQSQRESISMITSSSLLLQSIVDDVLDYSKLQSGNAEVDIRKCDIQEVVQDVINSMRSSVIARKRNISIETRFDPLLSQFIETDGRRLLQIMFNLTSNAIKYSKDNGFVQIRICVTDKVNKPIVHQEKEYTDTNNYDSKISERVPLVKFQRSMLRITVKDFGKGIAESNFDTIFQPFTQTNAGVRNMEGGTGLGLAITEKLVKALGGDIRVDSCLSEWTEFIVDLPYTTKEPPVTVSSIAQRFSNCHVFCVTGDPNGHSALLAGADQMPSNVMEYYLDDTLSYFGIEANCVPTMKSLEVMVQDRWNPPKKEPRGKMICVVSSNKVDPVIADRLFQMYSMKTVVIGPVTDNNCLSTDTTIMMTHYRSITEMIPHVFLTNLAQLCEDNSVGNYNPQSHLLSSPTDSNSNREREKEEAEEGSDLVVETPCCDLTTLRILCAEDNVVNQKIMTRMLHRLGVKDVVMVENGQLAVAAEKARPFDIVLMDLQMPVMDGIEATKLILGRPDNDDDDGNTNCLGHEKPQIVFVTAHVSSSFENECIGSGATAFLPKPYTLHVLEQTLLQVGGRQQWMGRTTGTSCNTDTTGT
ncbi:signal transduction histidine kinase [Nitzschia inconspicua]|uniref:Signal transduction histidine kinase n=1 Tax=Nitzschia inconspicua TaxID=303405 RepID=A0A9K3M7L2_9STRA|nr:signal transduction histidine kinase [Nitzschia inconspicua]